MDHEILRGQIVAKLKKYEAYIDNELPDYIMVMLANKKSIQQINNDLQLFLGENTDPFTSWLQQYLESEQHSQQSENVAEPTRTTPASVRTVATGVKRQRVDGNLSELKRDKDARILPNGGGSVKEETELMPSKVPRVKADEAIRLSQKCVAAETKSDVGHGRDLRELIAERRGPRRPAIFAVDEEEERERTNVSSVVRLVERPKGASGTTRLLERAIKGISGSSGGGIVKSKHAAENAGGAKSRTEKEAKGRIESEEQEQVEENFVDEFRAEQQIENEVKSPDAVLTAVKSSEETLSTTVEAKHTLPTPAVKQMSSNASNVSPPTDLRELLNRTKEAGKDTRTRFVVTMTGLEDKYLQPEPLSTAAIKEGGPTEAMEEETNDEDGAAAAKGGALERCRFWPNCKNGDTCPYLHPTVPCKMFPNCKYGNKCHYVHPVCKFDSRCTRPDCSYLHTAPRKMFLQPPKSIPSVVPVFRPSNFKPSQYSFGGSLWQRRQKFPTKSDLTWTPKQHISERQFAVSEEQTTQLSV